MLRNEVNIGDTVSFVTKGETKVGIVRKLNPKRAKVRVSDTPGFSMVWNVSYCLLTRVEAEEISNSEGVPFPKLRRPVTVSEPKLKVGTRVKFGRPNGEKHYGLIVRINPKSYAIHGDDGEPWRASHSLVTAV